MRYARVQVPNTGCNTASTLYPIKINSRDRGSGTGPALGQDSLMQVKGQTYLYLISYWYDTATQIFKVRVYEWIMLIAPSTSGFAGNWHVYAGG